jgi:hypothetical protein
MDSSDEAHALNGVIDRLTERFPRIPRTAIELAVREEYAVFDGSPVRDYVPVLVEHSTKKRLNDVVAPERRSMA